MALAVKPTPVPEVTLEDVYLKVYGSAHDIVTGNKACLGYDQISEIYIQLDTVLDLLGESFHRYDEGYRVLVDLKTILSNTDRG